VKKKHEQSIIDAFFNHFKRIAKKRYNRQVTHCSMDGQDSSLGADYLFTDNTRFILAEFKYREQDLSSEKRKPRMLRMCLLLDKDTTRKKQSLCCHYISWSALPKINFNQYYLEICNKNIFGNDDLKNECPDKSTRKSADQVIDAFLTQKIGAEYDLFKKYTEWLLKIDDNGESGVEIILDNPDSQELQLLDFKSIQSLKKWLDSNSPQIGLSRSSP